ncbi:aminopeptidase [Sedimenticola sp.]|uniref:aminopeptidase n=1 Tax=Sedimenticola sp. TaxID=1940285 RepID=UPI003D0C5864
MAWRYRWLLLTVLALLQGCSSLSYYSQSIGGHLQLMGQRRPINQLLQDPDTPPPIKRKLQRVVAMRTFATEGLGLPDNNSYRSYAALGRKAVVWSVVAAPAFSIQPKQWCYLFIGCASYRGYFSQDDAESYAATLQQQGWDVAVLPVPAYSTLGWFDDPLPSTVIDWPEAQVAGLIFHELAHQQLYVKNDSAFNEAFASLVEQEGVRRWLNGRDDAALSRWQLSRQREGQFIDLLLAVRDELDQLYRQPLDEHSMGQRKARLFEQLRERYQQLKQQWGGYAGFDGWFSHDLNNAYLASIATYETWVPAFQQLLKQTGGDLVGFYAASRALGELPSPQREQRLQALLQAADP